MPSSDARKRIAQPIFDAHLHIIDPRFPLIANQGYVPPPFGCEDYLAAVAPLGARGGAVVSGSFQGTDQTYLESALAALGPDYVGVTQLAPDASDAEILRLDGIGVRAVRFNLHRGGPADLAVLASIAWRVWDLARWHSELYVDAHNLAEIAPTLARLPRLSIDHLGMGRDGLAALLGLVEQGALVKATGFGRVSLDVPETLRAIAAANPGAMMFGTDLPSTRARRPFDPRDIDLVIDTLGEPLARRALRDNAVALYRPRRVAGL